MSLLSHLKRRLEDVVIDVNKEIFDKYVIKRCMHDNIIEALINIFFDLKTIYKNKKIFNNIYTLEECTNSNEALKIYFGKYISQKDFPPRH